MARMAHPHAMQPSKPGRTRTAPPKMPADFPGRGRYLVYILFDATGIVYLLAGGAVLCAVLALGRGEESWNALLASYRNPCMIAFHLLALVSVLFVGMRFFRLFPKAQPPRIGPAKPPPHAVISGMLYTIWIGATLLFSLILAGGLF